MTSSRNDSNESAAPHSGPREQKSTYHAYMQEAPTPQSESGPSSSKPGSRTKLVAFSLMLAVPAVLSGCGNEEYVECNPQTDPGCEYVECDPAYDEACVYDSGSGNYYFSSSSGSSSSYSKSKYKTKSKSSGFGSFFSSSGG